MQNTILIHAPGRRQGRGALVLAYTALFALLMGIWAAIFALNGQSFIQYGDTLKQHYPFLVYYGRWLRQAARCVLTGAAVPTWDFSIGYGADIITTLSYYGLGDPLDLLAAFVPGRWTEQLLEGLIVLRLYLAGLAVGYWESVGEIRKQWQAEHIFEPAADRTQIAKAVAGWEDAVRRVLREKND